MPVITIDYTPAYEQGGGIGRYVRELVAALGRQDHETHYRLFVTGARRSQLPPAPSANFTWRTLPLSPRWMARIWHRARLPLPVEWFTGPTDIYHATDFVLPPTRPQTRTMLTVHDLSFLRVPDAAAPRLRAYLERVVPLSINRADLVLADSEATRRDILAFYNTPSEKVVVLLSGVDERMQRIIDPAELLTIRRLYGVAERPFILAVGTVQPRKNYKRLIIALSHLRQRGYDLALVIAGGKGWLEDAMYRTLQETGMQNYVHLPGFVKDEHLPALYSAAECLAFPSLYEGFGFPILEAMACGTPVVSSNVSSMPEVAGDAALLIDPTDTEALTEALQRLLDDSGLRAELVAKGLERAGSFTWDAAAQQLRRFYAQLGG